MGGRVGERVMLQSHPGFRQRPGGARVVQRRVRAGELRVPPAPMPIRIERRHEVASGATGCVREDPLRRLLERSEPAEQHLSRVEHGGRFRLPDDAAADRARWQLDLDLPPSRGLGAGSELGTSQPPGGGIERRDDVARRLRIRRLPASALEIGVPCEAVGTRDAAVRRRVMGAH